MRDRIVLALERAGDLSTSELVRATGGHERTVVLARHRLVRDGVVVAMGQGRGARYRLAAPACSRCSELRERVQRLHAAVRALRMIDQATLAPCAHCVRLWKRAAKLDESVAQLLELLARDPSCTCSSSVATTAEVD